MPDDDSRERITMEPPPPDSTPREMTNTELFSALSTVIDDKLGDLAELRKLVRQCLDETTAGHESVRGVSTELRKLGRDFEDHSDEEVERFRAIEQRLDGLEQAHSNGAG